MSPWYFGHVLDYEPTFLSAMNMNLKVTGIFSNHRRLDRVRTYKGKSPSDIFAKLAKDEGWNVKGLDRADEYGEVRDINQSNLDPFNFVRQKLEPEAHQDKYPFIFYAETLSESGAVDVYFVRIDHFYNGRKDFNFFINAGNYGSVVSFTPQFTGKDIVFFKQSEAYLDVENNEITSFKSNQDSYNYGLTVYGSTNPDRFAQLISNRWFQQNVGCYKATMVIYGDPELKPLQYIGIWPMRPDGTIHHSGGTYMIIEISDNIVGDFRTTLMLLKATYIEDTHGFRGRVDLPGATSQGQKI